MKKLIFYLSGIIYISSLCSQQVTGIQSDENHQQQQNLTQSESKTGDRIFKYRIEIKAGSSSRTADISKNLIEPHRDYAEQLKKGYNISLSFLFLKKPLGIGLQLSYFNTSNSSNEILLLDDNGFLMNIGYRKDNISIIFLGSEFYYPYKPSPFFILYGKVTPGLLLYTNDVNFINSSITYSGNTLGINSSIGFEYLLNNNIGLNIDLSILQALSMKVKPSSTNSEKENVNRYDINVGIAIYL